MRERDVEVVRTLIREEMEQLRWEILSRIQKLEADLWNDPQMILDIDDLRRRYFKCPEE